MVESVSGQFQGMPKEPEAAPPAFHDPRTFVAHDYAEHIADLGEVAMNYAEAGSPANPALDAARAMSLLKNGRYLKIDASHVVNLDKPEAFTRILEAFFLGK